MPGGEKHNLSQYAAICENMKGHRDTCKRQALMDDSVKRSGYMWCKQAKDTCKRPALNQTHASDKGCVMKECEKWCSGQRSMRHMQRPALCDESTATCKR